MRDQNMVDKFDLEMGQALHAAMHAPYGSEEESQHVKRLKELLAICDLQMESFLPEVA